MSALTVLSLVLPLFCPSMLLTLAGRQIPSKKWWFLISAVFLCHTCQQWRGRPNTGVRNPAGVCGHGSFTQLGCARGSCVWALPCALPSVSSLSKDSVGKCLGVFWWRDHACPSPLLVLCLPSLSCFPVDSWWVWDSISPMVSVSLKNVYFGHLKLDSCTPYLLFMAVLCSCGSPGLALW